MLNQFRRFFAVFTSIVAIGMGLVAVTVGLASTSTAAEPLCKPPAVAVSDGGGGYYCEVPGGEGDPKPPGGGDGPAEPTCNLESGDYGGYDDKNPSPFFCQGTDVCFTVDLFAPVAPPDGEKPNEDSEMRVTGCRGVFGGLITWGQAFWSDDEEPTLLEQARTAIGQIDLNAPAVSMSPTTRTLVNLDTWFWVDGLQERATGSSAFGLVAIATFRSMSIDPGDGEPSFTCPLVTTKEVAKDKCFHEYNHSSRTGTASVDGRPAFNAQVHAVYDLSFEVDGDPIPPIIGAPTTLDAPTGNLPVRVDEVQSRVVQVR